MFLQLSSIVRPCLRSTFRCFHGGAYTPLTERATTNLAGTYFSEIEAEPLPRYRHGGYHPIHIADEFDRGRYRVTHKLGWGGYSTVWLAHDSLKSRLVALKVLVSETSEGSQEVEILRRFSTVSQHHSGRLHVCQLLDSFSHEGPNGVHRCLSLNLEGVSVPTLVSQHCAGRLPGSIAWTISKQIALALDYLHSHAIAHGGKSLCFQPFGI